MGKKIIALDAGHGMNTSGKRVTLRGYEPIREWWMNDRIADMVQADLTKNYECSVLRVDDTTGNKDIPLATRTKSANNAKADMYISIHHNAGIGGGAGGGTEVYYCSSNSKRREQAQRLFNFITDETKLYGNRCEQVIKKGYHVLKKTNMPAFLVENGYMDSIADVPVILSESHARKTANGIVAFLVKELSLEPKKVAEKGTQSVVVTSVYYPKYKGVKTTLHNAMQSLGIDASYKNRKAIAKANGITAYSGSAKQNTQMYNLLVAGLLKKA
jgi:N-acetylmuramoyl-L-alanine amidase